MPLKLKILLRLVYLIFLSLVFTSTIFLIVKNSRDVSIDMEYYRMYTSTGFLFAIFVIVTYAFLKLYAILLRVRYSLKNLILKASEKKQISSSNHNLASILRGGHNDIFPKMFEKNMNSKTLRLYMVYRNRIQQKQRLKVAREMFNCNSTSSVAGYIYANELFVEGKYEDARTIVRYFLDKNQGLVEGQKIMYLLSLLAIDIEKKLSSNLDFADRYIDNVEAYKKTFRDKVSKVVL